MNGWNVVEEVGDEDGDEDEAASTTMGNVVGADEVEEEAETVDGEAEEALAVVMMDHEVAAAA